MWVIKTLKCKISDFLNSNTCYGDYKYLISISSLKVYNCKIVASVSHSVSQFALVIVLAMQCCEATTTTVNRRQQSGAFEKKVSSHFHYWLQPRNLDIFQERFQLLQPRNLDIFQERFQLQVHLESIEERQEGKKLQQQ